MLFLSPCIGVREFVGEASAGACAGLISSRESWKIPGCRHRPECGRQHEDARYRERISTRSGPRPRHVQIIAGPNRDRSGARVYDLRQYRPGAA